MHKIKDFSLWCDFIERDFLKGEFIKLLERKTFNGVTTNPSIFKLAFLTSEAYKKERDNLKNTDTKNIYEKLAIEDIKIAATTMQKLYKNDNDGFVSIEVDPNICDDEKATIKESKRLFNEIGFENVMIKIPATKAGYKAMEELMFDGIHVNATLVFSPNQAKSCIEAFQRAKERLKGDKKLPKGVISVFVSRFDSKLDNKLKNINLEVSKTGIFNAMKIYDLIETYKLPNIRTLFASTGVKNDSLEKDYYIKSLLFKNSINTAPLEAIKSFIKSGDWVEITPSKEYIKYFQKLDKHGIDMQNVYDELFQDALKAFKDAFKEILNEL
ncbi:MAG: transaldolase [Sulfurospirillum sp.]|nr:transaldolase [Sulfurospirillum sp.]MBL0702474.1 transaldolase [Sulfurospirillum sp.]